MKKVLLNVLVLITLSVFVLPIVDNTFAIWSDNEVSENNNIATGSLDLLVSKCDTEWENPGPFKDDQPWGTGLDSCFNIDGFEPGVYYPSYMLLWNAGDVSGIACLSVTCELVPIAYSTYLYIWYDDDGDQRTPLILVTSDTIAGLVSRTIILGNLPAYSLRRLKIEIMKVSDSQIGSLIFNLEFQLYQTISRDESFAWADTEKNENIIEIKVLPQQVGEESSPEFWRNPWATCWYPKEQIVTWFAIIVTNSSWFSDIIVTGNIRTDYNTLRDVLKEPSDSGYEGQLNRFRRQYLAMCLGYLSGRLPSNILHNISYVPSATDYFGFEQAILNEIIQIIESKSEGELWSPPPELVELGIMESVCNVINTLVF